ncbi:hypothetical protein NDU88_004152 [Pleurodeles waltl]|uniref:Uncharacterized protein n=1 Tax=Pleurodeles waltl TaxID=8319 RepID=A0AAV7WUQ2_PLEWA|nr:hypothetical protein NDU88_004152 [Pleurodeles waltl]
MTSARDRALTSLWDPRRTGSHLLPVRRREKSSKLLLYLLWLLAVLVVVDLQFAQLHVLVLVVGGEFVQLILAGEIMASRRMTAQQVVGMLFESQSDHDYETDSASEAEEEV